MGNTRKGLRYLGAVALWICISIDTSSVEAVTLNFDSYPGGTAITNQFQSAGVLFVSNGGQPAHAWNDPGEATSDPNILVGASNFADLFIDFVDPVSGLPSADFRGCGVQLKVISVGWATITVSSRDSAGQILQSFVLTHPGGPANGFGHVDPVSFTDVGIASVDMVFTVHGPPGVDGVGIDDLTFELGCPPPVPVESRSWGRIKSLYR